MTKADGCEDVQACRTALRVVPKPAGGPASHWRHRAEGHEVRDEDIARLSPLKHRDRNVLRRYSFTASTPSGGALRPLRDPDTVELDEDDEG